MPCISNRILYRASCMTIHDLDMKGDNELTWL